MWRMTLGSISCPKGTKLSGRGQRDGVTDWHNHVGYVNEWVQIKSILS